MQGTVYAAWLPIFTASVRREADRERDRRRNRCRESVNLRRVSAVAKCIILLVTEASSQPDFNVSVCQGRLAFVSHLLDSFLCVF